jgi:hypothetical protein
VIWREVLGARWVIDVGSVFLKRHVREQGREPLGLTKDGHFDVKRPAQAETATGASHATAIRMGWNGCIHRVETIAAHRQLNSDEAQEEERKEASPSGREFARCCQDRRLAAGLETGKPLTVTFRSLTAR